MFGFVPLPRTLDAALRDLDSKKAATRASAIADLARHGAADDATRVRAISLLERCLTDDEPSVRSAAAIALADLRAAEALPQLLVAVEDDDAQVRQLAIAALGEIGDLRAQSRLARALRDDRPEVRYQALIAYTRVLRDDDAEVAGAVRRGLADDDDSIRYIALRIAEERVDDGKALDGVLAPARPLLEASDVDVRVAAAVLLAKCGDFAGRELLLDVVAHVGPSVGKEDEREVVELVGALGLDEAIPALERRAFGVARLVRDTCEWHAIIALARLGHAGAANAIARDLASPSKDKREAAVVAVGRARLRRLRGAIEELTAADADKALVDEALRALDADRRATS